MDLNRAVPSEIEQALARGFAVLTANQRAARTLRRAFDRRRHAQALTHWQPPLILAWDSWLASLWHRLLLEGRASALLLNSTQEHALWHSIIATDPGASNLDSLAELAADAWSRLHAWHGRPRLRAAANTADTRAFARWADAFERRCDRAQLLTAAQLPETLAAAIANSESAAALALPPGLLLVGFDSQTPAQFALLESLRAAGTIIDELDATSTSVLATNSLAAEPSHLLVDAPDPQTELLACATWLRARLTEYPHAQLAVIVPSIDADRAQIDRAFRRILAPELDSIAAPTSSGPFEFSLGIPLVSTPLAATALDILHWALGPLPLDRVSTLLLSPHFAAASPDKTELLARAEFDAFALRRESRLQPQLTIDALSTQLARSRHATAMPALRAHLQSLSLQLRRANLTRNRSHADWAAAFAEILAAAGWAPPAHLSSVEFQTRRKFEGALDELASLDFDSDAQAAPRISFSDALDALTRIAAETLFAPESRHAPIQIMGPLESAGSCFDAIWFLRAGDASWPSTPSTNPLLPWLLQRELGMPGADPARDTALARRITTRIAASAETVLFSYARQTPGSTARQRPSPVLSALALTARTTAQVAPAEPAPTPIPLDSLIDDTPIPAPPVEALRGGASILEAQAACAFRAFAERRLFSSALDEVSLGLDARERGSLVHAVLHTFWTEVGNQAELRRMTIPNRDALLAQSIDSALARHHPHPAEGWPRTYLDAERSRLQRLLAAWLHFEATDRPPFVVKSREEELEAVQIGPLRLNVRVDRVDTLGNPDDTSSDPDASTDPATGPPAEIILDYKTGRADPAAWNGPRPESPQLPLYAVVSPAPHLAAVAFASIRPGNLMGLAGLQAQIGILPDATKKQTRDLELQRAEWRSTLTVLAEDFHAGRALADPKTYPTTCRYCRQRLLCRLDLSSLDPATIEDSDDTTDGISLTTSSDPEA